MRFSLRAKQWLVKQLNLSPAPSNRGWFPLFSESYIGAWQQNVEVRLADVLTHPIVFACIALISQAAGKLEIKLKELDESTDIWMDTDRSAFSPVLRKPNHFQNRIEFIEQWLVSKLSHGNTYVLKVRDIRSVVTAMYVLDPCRVIPLVAPDGSVFYQLQRDDLSLQPEEPVVVPASEIIHNRMNALYHPLVGLSPIYASGLAAVMGLKILNNSANLFANGSNPGGILTTPLSITTAKAAELKALWDANYTGANVGKVAVLGDGLKFEAMRVNAVDSQLDKQSDWVSQMICATFLVPAYMVGVGPQPLNNNVEALQQQFYSLCLQSHLESLELCLDEGLGLAPDKIQGVRLGTEFDLDNLLRMDTATMMKSISDGVGAGVLKPNEGRRKLNYAPVEGGDTPYLQEQNWPLRLLSSREIPTRPPTPPAELPPAASAAEKDFLANLATVVREKAIREGLYAA
jgi:HK97 family phage portal protein